MALCCNKNSAEGYVETATKKKEYSGLMDWPCTSEGTVDQVQPAHRQCRDGIMTNAYVKFPKNKLLYSMSNEA